MTIPGASVHDDTGDSFYGGKHPAPTEFGPPETRRRKRVSGHSMRFTVRGEPREKLSRLGYLPSLPVL